MSVNAPQLRVKFFSMTNVDGVLYAKFDVVRPKKILLEDVVVDLTKLGAFSKSLENGIFVGWEQERKDSLYVAKNTTKTWQDGHIGFFSLSNTLMFGNDDPIRKAIGVGGDFDGEWSSDDILDGLSEKEIQSRVDEYKNDPWIRGYPIMKRLFLEDATRENFETEEFLNNFIKKCIKHGIPEKVYKHYIEYDIKYLKDSSSFASHRLMQYWDNDSILAEQGLIPKEGTNYEKLAALDFPDKRGTTVDSEGYTRDAQGRDVWAEWDKHEDERVEERKKMLAEWKEKKQVNVEQK